MSGLHKNEEPFAGRYYGAVNVDGDDCAPIFMFADEAEAWDELKRRQALPDDDDARLSDNWSILVFDIEGLMWNSYDENPREAPTGSRLWDLQRELERAEDRVAELSALLQAKCGYPMPTCSACTRTGCHDE